MQRSKFGHAEAEKPTAIALVADFLTRFWKPMVIIVGAAAVVVIALFVTISIQQSQEERSYEAVEALQREYSDWARLEEEERTAGFAVIAESMDEVAAQYAGEYAGGRAQLLKADALRLLERYTEAAAEYMAVAEGLDETYLAPVALLYAAVTLEEADSPNDALGAYGTLVSDYGDVSPSAPRALFSMGRINEGIGEIAEAALVYENLIDDYPTSSWTNLARTRIISLTAQGRIGE